MPRFLHLLSIVLLLSACDETAQETPGCDFQSIIPPHKSIDCGYITVPENHDQPAGKKIHIAYVVLHAENVDTVNYPVIYLSGGPGSSVIDSITIKKWYTHPFRASRDIILFDQRGIGYSSALPNMHEEMYNIMAKNATAEEERMLFSDLIGSYKQMCADNKIDLTNYNTFQNARDVGSLMEHLGYEKYNLYGVSYGTRLARVTQDLFPEKLNSVILNSPNPIKGDMLVDRLKSYSLALSRVFEYCESTPECQASNPKLEEDYINAIKSMAEKPLLARVNGDSAYLNAQDGIFFVRRLLYGNNSRTNIPALIREYLQGGGQMVTGLVREEYTPDYNYTMWLAVERHEMYDLTLTAIDLNKVYDSLPLLPAKLGLFHAAYLNLGKLHDSGAAPEKKKFQPSAIPTLITVNQFDPVTPPENGHIMMKTLSRGQLFILDEGGHGGGNTRCRNKVMSAFMDNPDGPLDTSCLNVYREQEI